MEKLKDFLQRLDEKVKVVVTPDYKELDRYILDNFSINEISIYSRIYYIEKMFRCNIISIENKYLEYKNIMLNLENNDIGESLTSEILLEVNNYIKLLPSSIKTEDVDESVFYEIILNILTSIPNIVEENIQDLNVDFIDLLNVGNKVATKHYVDSLSLINYDGNCNYNFIGHTTTAPISKQGSLFFENTPCSKYKKLYILKSYNSLSTKEKSYIDHNVDEEKFMNIINNLQFYSYIYKAIQNKIDIGKKYINTNIQYIMNTYLIFIGDKKGLENNHNVFLEKTFYNKKLNINEFYTYEEEYNDKKTKEKCYQKIREEIEYLLNSLNLQEFEKNLYSLSLKLRTSIENAIKVYRIINFLYPFSENVVIKQKIEKLNNILGIELIPLDINISRLEEKDYDFTILASDINQRINRIKHKITPIDESIIKKEILDNLKPIINSLKQPQINQLMKTTFICDDEKEFYKFYKCNEDLINKTLVNKKLKMYLQDNNENTYKKHLIRIFFFNNPAEVIQNELYRSNNNVHDFLFLFFTLIFNLKFLENEIMKIENKNSQESTYNTLRNCFYMQEENPKLLISFLVSLFLYPNFNFLTNDAKISMIKYLYYSLYDSYLSIKENKLLIDEICDLIISEYESNEKYQENKFLLSLSNKNIKMLQLIITCLYFKTTNTSLKEGILKLISHTNYSAIFSDSIEKNDSKISDRDLF